MSMPQEFKAIVRSEYGSPEKVPRIENCPLKSDEITAHKIVVNVMTRPIHHGDIHIESNTGTNIYSLAPNSIALKSVSILNWFRLAEDEKQKDFELALTLATNHRHLSEVAHEYAFEDFQKAIQHVSRPGKTGIALLKS